MAKLPRVTHTIFAGSAAAAALGIEQYGSFAANYPGAPTYTINIATIQALPAWSQGWNAAVLAGFLPAIEDMNAVQFEHSYQSAYIFEMGIPEWDSGTTYFTNSIAQKGGIIYKSAVDNNLNNDPASNPTKWEALNFGGVLWGGTGNVNPFSLTISSLPSGFDPVADSLAVGTLLSFGGSAVNAAATTLSINGGPTYTITDANGNNVSQLPLQYGATPITLIWGGTSWILIDVSVRTTPKSYYLQAVGGTANAITATTAGGATDFPVLPGSSDPPAGTSAYLIPTSTNTGSTTLSLNGLTPVAITNKSGGALTGGELTVGHIYHLVFETSGDTWRIVA